eukprot:NODE_5562_length_690_cov_164.660746_g5539_i0.p1 GENE.NODE_5562_length_690_cov_164.660746_g5539_i0~~NODE_5562_length_690_cov_164.660746_g5539_i0.p1  ORF type:complete len:196 (-),score=33.74 NODE_5562_length_690_cov_164.660746_g5539_i0:25-612(-)
MEPGAEALRLHERPAQEKPQVEVPKPKKKRASTPVAVEVAASPVKHRSELNVEFVLSQDRDAKLPKPYHECGNTKMYTPENLSKRAALRHNDAVKGALDRFARLYKLDSEGNVTKESYMIVHKQLCSALRPGMTASEIDDTAEQDWEVDAGPEEQLSAAQLRTILFDFADIWTQGTDANEYLMFLDKLYFKLAGV